MLKKIISTLFVLFLTISVSAYFLLNPEKKQLDKTTRIALGGTYIQLAKGITHYSLKRPLTGHTAEKPVVLIHGGTIPMWTWDEQVRALTDAGFTVLTYDQYGRGYSDRPDTDYDQALYLEQLAELIKKLDIDQPFDLIGLSLGGGTAVNFAAQNPEKVDKLILISPVICDFKTSTIFKIPVLGEFIARVAGVGVIVKRFKHLLKDNDDLEKYTKLFIEQTTYKGFERSILSMVRNDAMGDYSSAYKKVGDLAIKTLLVRGTQDTEITEDMIKKIKHLIPEIEYRPVDDTGHGIVFQKGDIVNKLILDFLNP